MLIDIARLLIVFGTRWTWHRNRSSDATESVTLLPLATSFF